jgi:hypothetical protein
VHVVEIVEMDNEELYIADDVLEEASNARYLSVNERQWAKNDERKWSERKKNLHPLVTRQTHFLRRIEENYIVVLLLNCLYPCFFKCSTINKNNLLRFGIQTFNNNAFL